MPRGRASLPQRSLHGLREQGQRTRTEAPHPGLGGSRLTRTLTHTLTLTHTDVLKHKFLSDLPAPLLLRRQGTCRHGNRHPWGPLRGIGLVLLPPSSRQNSSPVTWPEGSQKRAHEEGREADEGQARLCALRDCPTRRAARRYRVPRGGESHHPRSSDLFLGHHILLFTVPFGRDPAQGPGPGSWRVTPAPSSSR